MTCEGVAFYVAIAAGVLLVISEGLDYVPTSTIPESSVTRLLAKVVKNALRGHFGIAPASAPPPPSAPSKPAM